MRDEYFIDTNVIAYVFDPTDAAKRERCARLVGGVATGQISGCVSNQVLAELYSTLVGKMRKTMSAEGAATIVDVIVESDKWRKLNYTERTLVRAMRSSRKTGMSLWDSIIVETMLENGVRKIVTEDKAFRKAPGITAISPF